MSTSDLRTISSKALLGFGGIVAVGLVLAALVISGAVKSIAPSNESITVKGLAETGVKADNARWQLNVVSNGSTASEAYAQLRKDQKILTDFLIKQGFKSEQLELSLENSRELYNEKRDKDGNYEREFVGYQAYQTVAVSTKDVNQMESASKQAFQLDEMDIKVENSQPEYLVSNLEEVKMSLIAKATENAYLRASEFAKSGKVNVGSMRSASQGAFYILAAQGGTDDGDYGGVYDKSTIDKTARVVVTINYGIRQ